MFFFPLACCNPRPTKHLAPQTVKHLVASEVLGQCPGGMMLQGNSGRTAGGFGEFSGFILFLLDATKIKGSWGWGLLCLFWRVDLQIL